MFIESSKGPFCQSCGMPMKRSTDFGMGKDGKRVNDYCHFCFDDGQFTQPDMTAQQMIDQCTSFMARQTFTPEHEARQLMTNVIPGLKRWRPMPPAAA